MNNLQLLNEIKQKLLSEFPGIIEKIILFGSQVNGSATQDSDFDILVIVNMDYDWKLKNQILDLLYDFDLKYDIFTDVKIISVGELKTIRGKQPFILEAFEYGIAV
ncbi:MAG: nucleotidyltransferase domain-containing protein [Ignavibacteriaceae bacterium]